MCVSLDRMARDGRWAVGMRHLRTGCTLTHLICMDLKKVAMHAGEGALRAEASFFISFSLGYGSASYAAHSLACTCGEAFAYHLPAASHRVEDGAPEGAKDAGCDGNRREICQHVKGAHEVSIARRVLLDAFSIRRIRLTVACLGILDGLLEDLLHVDGAIAEAVTRENHVLLACDAVGRLAKKGRTKDRARSCVCVRACVMTMDVFASLTRCASLSQTLLVPPQRRY